MDDPGEAEDPQAGWYPEPDNPGKERLWDGDLWTHWVRPPSKDERIEMNPAGWRDDPTRPDTERLWTGDAWTDLVRPAPGSSLPTSPAPVEPPIQTLAEFEQVELDNLLVLGGFGFPLLPGGRYALVFGLSDAQIRGPGGDGELAITIPYSDLTNLLIEGPGKIREGGGFIGGGFGVEEFAIGAAAASVLNSLTTRHRIETLIGLQASERELVFLCTSVEPSALGLRLARVRGLLRSSASPAQGDADLVAELGRLAELVERGFLERDEFDVLKRRMIGGTR
jgi:hypothetical protein